MPALAQTQEQTLTITGLPNDLIVSWSTYNGVPHFSLYPASKEMGEKTAADEDDDSGENGPLFFTEITWDLVRFISRTVPSPDNYPWPSLETTLDKLSANSEKGTVRLTAE